MTNMVGVKIGKTGIKKEPWWKRRLEGQIKDIRRELSWVNAIKENKPIKKKNLETLQRKYKLKKTKLLGVKEELIQKLKAKSGKIKRYDQRIKQYHQNRQFRNNGSGFYSRLNSENVHVTSEIPGKKEAKEFWSNLWSKNGTHNENAKWLKDFETSMNGKPKQEGFIINSGKVQNVLSKIPNWKAPGPDGVQGFWLKYFKSMHQWLVKYLAECYKETKPAWMTKGRTVLIQKDKSKGTFASNYRPITCLPLCWKVLTVLLTDEIYAFLENNQFLPEEQKGCRRKSRETEDQLYIDKMILKEVKTRKKNLAMGWIDYQKALDMLPHSWIIDCLYSLGLNKKLITFLQSTMKNWRVKLTCNNENLGKVEIKRGLFQGDSLSPLLFVIALIPLTQILKATRHCYSFANKEKINHLLYMDDHKLYAKTEEELDSLVQTL